MGSELKKLLEQIETTDPEQLAMARQVSKDLALLLARITAGGFVQDREFDHLAAQVGNLTAASAAQVREAFVEWAVGVTGRLIEQVLPG